MKKKFICAFVISLVIAFCSSAFAAVLKDNVNNGSVLYLMNNQPKDEINFTISGYLYNRAGIPEYYNFSGTLKAGSCVGILSQSDNIVGDSLGTDGKSKKSHLEIHFFGADKTGYRVFADGVNSRKSKQFGSLLNLVEQDYLYPYNYTWVLNTNNPQHDINFGSMQMTRSMRYSSLTPQVALDDVLATPNNKILDGRTPIGLVYFPLNTQIVGSITCYYYAPDGTMPIVDSPQFFDNICKGNYFTNTGKEMNINA